MNVEKTIEQVQHLIGGYFKYYKGGIVRLDDVVTDSETNKTVVIYTDMSDTKSRKWSRPAKTFFGYVQCGEKMVIRFDYHGKSSVELNKIMVIDGTENKNGVGIEHGE